MIIKYINVPCTEVNSKLIDGYQPYGNPYVISSVAFQAMVKCTKSTTTEILNGDKR